MNTKKIITTLFSITIFFLLFLSNSIFTFGEIKTIIYKDKSKTIVDDIHINEISANIVNTHLNIGFNKPKDNEESVIGTIKKLEALALLDIITSLEIGTNKEKSINKYIADSINILSSASIIKSNLVQELSYIKSDLDDCINKKASSDKLYFQSINTYNQKMSEEAIEESKKHGICISEKSINYNSKNELIKRLNYYIDLLNKKYKYIETQKTTIINNFELIKNNTIYDITRIKETLEKENY